MEPELLQILNESLENYFLNTIIPQLYVDASLWLRKFTPPAMKQFSLSDADIGKHISELTDNISYPTIIENIEEVIATGIILEKEVQTIDKRWFQMNILPYMILKTNKMDGVIITFVDVTSRVKMLAELEKINTDIYIFIQALHHDIRQPITTLTLISDLLDNAFDDNNRENYKQGIDTHKRSINRINVILNDLKSQTNSQATLSQERERLSIETIYEDVKFALADATYNKDISIDTEFNISEIKFSRKNLRSILYNLLTNSIKYRKPNKPLTIKIKTNKDADYMILTVEDNGIGIDANYLDTIFEKGIRLNNEIEGTGMGLFIVKTMLENDGGKIDVQSSIGEGTKFILYFKNVFDKE